MPKSPAVLVIDDDPEIQAALLSFIGEMGYRVNVASNALEGVASARRDAPALILMDVSMPGMNGDLASSLIREATPLGDIPILLMSALPHAEIATRIRDSRAVEFLQKPFNADAVAACVRRWVKDAPGAREDGAPRRAGRILLVDDEPQIGALVGRLLREAGYHVTYVEDPVEALHCAAEAPPDLVITDYEMPGLDGAEFCVFLKSRRATSGVPILFMSGKAPDSGDECARFSGAAGYFEKPIDVARLIGRVDELLLAQRPPR